MINSKPTDYPSLPGLLRLPVKLLPRPLSSAGIGKALNTLFATQLQEGELEFMLDRQINIDVEDAGLRFSVRLDQQRLVAGRPTTRPDLTVSGQAYAFLLLGAREEDADTLFFRQEIKTQGDTELGLYLKNFLDGIDLEDIPAGKQLDQLMRGALKLARLPLPGRR